MTDTRVFITVAQISTKEPLLTSMTAEYFLIHNSCNW